MTHQKVLKSGDHSDSDRSSHCTMGPGKSFLYVRNSALLLIYQDFPISIVIVIPIKHAFAIVTKSCDARATTGSGHASY